MKLVKMPVAVQWTEAYQRNLNAHIEQAINQLVESSDQRLVTTQHAAAKATQEKNVTSESGVLTLDGRLTNVFRTTLTENITSVVLTAPLSGQVIKLRMKQDATGGRTITWPAGIRWVMGGEPILSTAANAVDVAYLGYDEGDAVWEGSFLPDLTGTGTGWGLMTVGPPGPAGAVGAAGPTGPTGPSGSVPVGGLTGEVLTKLSDTDGDADWQSLGAIDLSSLGDVDVTGLVDGDALVWDTTTSSWIPAAHSISGLSDVDLTGIADGDVLVWDTTTSTWLPEAPGGGGSSPTTTHGDMIVRNATVDQRLAIGVDFDVLQVDTSVTGKVKWGGVGIPQNAQTGNYGIVAADNGRSVDHLSGAGSGDIITIPANGTLALPIGFTFSVLNMDSNTMSVAITTDTLYWLPTGATGTRTIAQYGCATFRKFDTTKWICVGVGVS